jgi:hypothetical protein
MQDRKWKKILHLNPSALLLPIVGDMREARPSPRPNPSGRTRGRSAGGRRAAGARAASTANAWDRGAATLHESAAAPSIRNPRRLGFVVGQRKGGSTPWNQERRRWCRGGWSATRGVAGARRNRLATAAAATGSGGGGKGIWRQRWERKGRGGGGGFVRAPHQNWLAKFPSRAYWAQNCVFEPRRKLWRRTKIFAASSRQCPENFRFGLWLILRLINGVSAGSKQHVYVCTPSVSKYKMF